MFEKLRERLLYALLPNSIKQEMIHPFNTLSFHTSGQPVYSDLSVKKATREGYKLSVYVYRAVRTIVTAASGIPWYVEKGGEPVKVHPFTQAWANPNPQFSGQDNMEFLIAHLKLVGNALIQPLMVNGQPKEFWMCMPDMIKPIPSERKGEWIEKWEITQANGKKDYAPPEQFIHFMQFDPGNPYWGVGDLLAAARTVDTDNEAQDTQKVQLQNRNVPPGVFQFENNLTDEQYEEVTRRVREKFLQKKKRGEPWVIGGGYKWQQMSLSPVEMDYIKSRLHNLRTIAAAYGLDPWWLGDREHSTYNNVNEARKALYEDTVIPLLDDIKATLNLKLAPLYPDNITITYDLSNVAALRQDFGKKVEQGNTLFAMGVPFSQINEKLELGFEEFPGWDVGYLPFNLMPAVEGAGRETMPAKAVKAGEFPVVPEDPRKETRWKVYARKAEAHEKAFKSVLAKLFEAQSKEVIRRLEETQSVDSAIFARSEWDRLFADSFEKLIHLVFEQSYSSTIDSLGKSVTIPEIKQGEDDILDELAIAWIRAKSLRLAKQMNDTTIMALRAALAKGVEEGESIPQMTERIRQFYQDSYKHRAPIAARTEVIAATNEAHLKAFEDSGISRVEFYPAKDERTCPECMGLYQYSKEWSVSEAHEIIPVHPQCRCTWLEVIEK